MLKRSLKVKDRRNRSKIKPCKHPNIKDHPKINVKPLKTSKISSISKNNGWHFTWHLQHTQELFKPHPKNHKEQQKYHFLLIYLDFANHPPSPSTKAAASPKKDDNPTLRGFAARPGLQLPRVESLVGRQGLLGPSLRLGKPPVTSGVSKGKKQR